LLAVSGESFFNTGEGDIGLDIFDNLNLYFEEAKILDSLD
jgi:hypothetical protein